MDAKDEARLAYYRKNISEGRVDAKMSTRILAAAADALLVWLISLILFTGLIQILVNGGLSQELGALTNSMREQAIASGLVLYDGEGAAETEVVRTERYVRYMWNYDASEAPTDELFRYYCVFTTEGKEATPVSDFYKNILKIEEENSFFEVSGDYAVLKQNYRDLLTNYYSGEKTSEGIIAHRDIAAFYIAAHNDAWATFRGLPVYDGLLNSYMQKATAFYLAVGGVHIGCYLASSLICFIVIPVIKKRGTTFGKKILRIEPCMVDGNPITLPAIFGRGSVEMLLGVWIIPLSGLFIYGFDSMTVPFIAIGGFVLQLSVFFLAGLALSIASLAFALARKDNRALTDLAGGTWVISADVVMIRNAQAELRETMKEEKRNAGRE